MEALGQARQGVRSVPVRMKDVNSFGTETGAEPSYSMLFF